MGADSRLPPIRARGLQGLALPTVGVAAAAAVGYAAHHSPPLSSHTATTLLAVLVGAALLGLAASVLETGRRHPPLPRVVLAGPGATELRPGRSDDVAFCAALHAQSLGYGFFPALGPRFLRAYYRTLFESPHAAAIVATAAETPIGFVVGETSPRAHTRRALRRHGIRLAALAVAALLTRPATGLRFLRTRARRYAGAWRRHRGRVSSPPRPSSEAAPAILSHVAVLPGARGAGVGGELVDEFVGLARSAGADRVVLLTLDGDTGAGSFYAARGWQPGGLHTTPDGLRMREWTLELEKGGNA